MIGCLQTRVRKQPIIALYFEFENELKFYNLEAWFSCSVANFGFNWFPVLDEILGGSKKSQQERLNERLARKKQLIAERNAAGLNTDEATINAIIDDEEQQEEKRKRRVCFSSCLVELRYMCRDTWFPRMLNFDKCRLRRACAASF